MLDDAVASYLSEGRRFRSPKTIAACERILRVFGSRFPQRSLASIQREDLLEHMAALQGEGLGPRTIYNHVMRLKTFFRSRGIVGLLKREDMPAYDERAAPLPVLPGNGFAQPGRPLLHWSMFDESALSFTAMLPHQFKK